MDIPFSEEKDMGLGVANLIIVSSYCTYIHVFLSRFISLETLAQRTPRTEQTPLYFGTSSFRKKTPIIVKTYLRVAVELDFYGLLAKEMHAIAFCPTRPKKTRSYNEQTRKKEG